MGCVVSKKTAPATPVVESTGASGSLELSGGILNPALWNRIEVDRSESRDSGKLSYGTYSLSFRLGNFHKQVEGEQVAAAWPSWLSGVTREAIYGSFQKLEKETWIKSDAIPKCGTRPNSAKVELDYSNTFSQLQQLNFSMRVNKRSPHFEKILTSLPPCLQLHAATSSGRRNKKKTGSQQLFITNIDQNVMLPGC